ncbi:MAG: Rieske 2Fe-2S domain-containing protein [Nitrosarchaeum sp.]|nr:Rieske 2Fe-2S domain-containing protein [Nitrosarchaeum sp.]
MKVKFLGQAGILVESKTCKLVCDPWFSPTGGFLARWHQFPPNDHIDKNYLLDANYIYISHEHHDHFDREFLKLFPKDTPVILANFQTKGFRDDIKKLGFQKIIEVNDWQRLNLADDFEIMVVTDPGKYKEDSSLFIKTEGFKILNKNDCYLSQDYLKKFSNMGIDLLFTQFSGAIWYPMVYQYDTDKKRKLAKSVRERLRDYFISVVNSINPTFVIPSAGPPCFLEDDCFQYNFEENGIFPDQHDFTQQISDKINCTFNMMLPNDDVILENGKIIFENKKYFDFDNKEKLLKDYQQKRSTYINEYLNKIQKPDSNLYKKFSEHFTQVLNSSNYFSSNVGQLIEFDIKGDNGGCWQVDFRENPPKIYNKKIGEPGYRFEIESKYLNLIVNDHINWEDFLLSLRFKVWRNPDIYNGALFALLQYGRDPLLIQRAENYELKSKCPITINVQDGNKMYKIQRFCPHLGEDLKNGTIKNGVLVCPRHQWNFDLNSHGKCIAGGNKDLPIYEVTEIDEAENTGMS